MTSSSVTTTLILSSWDVLSQKLDTNIIGLAVTKWGPHKMVATLLTTISWAFFRQKIFQFRFKYYWMYLKMSPAKRLPFYSCLNVLNCLGFKYSCTIKVIKIAAPWGRIPKFIFLSHDGLVQDCSNSSALAMQLLQSCTKPSIWPWWFVADCPLHAKTYQHNSCSWMGRFSPCCPVCHF